MKKTTKNDRIVILSICAVALVTIAIFVAITIFHAKNSTQTLCANIRTQTQSGDGIRIVLQQKEGDENYSQPLFKKEFSQTCANSDLSPLVFSKSKGVSEYFYLITLTNSETSIQNYSVKLVQKGTNKDCCLPKQIEVEMSSGGEFEKTHELSGILAKNDSSLVEIRFRANLETITASPNSEFEILVESSKSE